MTEKFTRFAKKKLPNFYLETKQEQQTYKGWQLLFEEYLLD